MAPILHSCEKLLCHYQIYKSKSMDKSHKMEGYYHGAETSHKVAVEGRC